jgi:hypothetical protein
MGSVPGNENAESNQHAMNRFRRLILIRIWGAAAGLAMVLAYPVSSTLTKSLLLGLGAAVWLGCLLWGWRQRGVRWFLLALPCLAAVFLLLPARLVDRAVLRQCYTERLQSFEGTRYVWGGESRWGIDCSGLPRRAFRDALFWYGLRHADGGALRQSLEQWWFDTSARALGEGYRQFTVPAGPGFRISQMEDSALQPGDLAVTRSGIHVLVYVGAGQWIQADPSIGHVATLHGQHDNNSYFNTLVTPHRWRVLAEP